MKSPQPFLYKFRLARFRNKLTESIKGQVLEKQPVHQMAIRHMAILFDASGLEDKNEVLRFAKLFDKLSIQVHLLAYLDYKAGTSGLPFRHFNRGDISFFFIPANSDIRTFLGFKYDLLVNADLNQNLSIHYLAALAHSPYKVGPKSLFDAYYHLILDTSDTFSIKQYISELILILNKVSFHGHLVY